MNTSKRIFAIILLAVTGTVIMIVAVTYLPIPGISLSKKLALKISESSYQTDQYAQSHELEETLENSKEIKTKEDLEEMVNQKKPVVLKIYSAYCPPCIRANQAWPHIAKEFNNRVIFYSLNTSESGLLKIAEEKNVLSQSRLATPTFFFRNKGENINKIEGFANEETLSKQISSEFNF